MLQRVSNVGFRLQKKKCIFLAPEVEYLGHKIDAKGIHPLSHKVEAIHAAPTPNDVTQLKSYLGLITYYGKFLPNLSTTLAPLYQLLKKSTPWKWAEVEEKAFQESKDALSSSSVLVHFDP